MHKRLPAVCLNTMLTLRKLIVALSLCVAAAAAEVPLTGQWYGLENPQENPVDLPKAGWKPLPSPRMQRLYEFPATLTSRVWLKLQFSLPANVADMQDPVLYLGPIQEADRIWLNGRLVGQTGRVGQTYRDSVPTPDVPRAYPLRKSDLRVGPEQSNTLFIHLQSLSYPGGVWSLPPKVVEAEQAQELVSKETQRRLVEQLLPLAFVMLMTFAVLLAMVMLPRQRPILFWQAVLGCAIAMMLLLENVLLQTVSWRAPWVAIASMLSSSLAFMTFAPIAIRLHWLPRRPWVWGLAGLMFISLTLAALSKDPAWMYGYFLVFSIAIMPLGIAAFWGALRRFRFKKQPGGVAAVLAALLFLVALLILPFPFTMRHFDIAVLCLIAGEVCLFISTIQQLAQVFVERESLMQRIATGVEEERRRMTTELHDGVGQYLAAARLQLSAIEGRAPNPELAKAVVALGEAGDEMRRVVRATRPLALERGDNFVRVLEDECERFRHDDGPTLSLHAPTDLKLTLALPIAQPLLRIVQESLSNALRHAKASRIDVRLRRSNRFATAITELGGARRWLLTIEDDGIGMDHRHMGKGLGLQSMRERAEVASAELDIQTSKKGTTVSIEFRENPE